MSIPNKDKMNFNPWRSWRDPVPDGRYFVRLGRSDCLDFVCEDSDAQHGNFLRVNYKAEIVGPIDVPAGLWQRSAYGHLRSNRDRHETHSPLTSFLKECDLFKPPMGTSRRLKVAKELISIHPLMVGRTIWIGYSRLQGITVLRGMCNFPQRTNGSYEPCVSTKDGEEIRAVAYVDGLWTVNKFLIDLQHPASVTDRRHLADLFKAGFDPMEALNNARTECRERGHEWKSSGQVDWRDTTEYEWCPSCGADRSGYSDRDEWHQWPEDDEEITIKADSALPTLHGPIAGGGI
jgi:hypothetical protein